MTCSAPVVPLYELHVATSHARAFPRQAGRALADIGTERPIESLTGRHRSAVVVKEAVSNATAQKTTGAGFLFGLQTQKDSRLAPHARRSGGNAPSRKKNEKYERYGQIPIQKTCFVHTYKGNETIHSRTYTRTHACWHAPSSFCWDFYRGQRAAGCLRHRGCYCCCCSCCYPCFSTLTACYARRNRASPHPIAQSLSRVVIKPRRFRGRIFVTK